MTKKILLAGVILFGVAAAGCGTHRYSQKVSITSDLAMALPIPNADHKESEMILDYNVLGTDAKGTKTIEVTIASLKASLISLSVSCQYDSEAPSAAGAEHSEAKVTPDSNTGQSPSLDKSREDRLKKHQRQFEESFSGLKGKSYLAKVDARGKVIDLQIKDERLLKIADQQAKGALAGDQLAMLLSRDRLREYVAPAVIESLNGSSLKTTKNWSTTIPIEVPRAQACQAREDYTLQNIEKSTDGSVAVVDMRTTELIPSQDEKSDAAQAGAGRESQKGFVVVAVKGQGQARIRLSDNRLIDQQETLNVDVRTNAARKEAPGADQTRKKTSVYTIKRTLERLEKH
jgi:hypothetical protein